MKIKLFLIAAVAALAMFPNLTMAQTQVKGAQLLMPIKTVADLQQVEPGDTILMSCPKCKDTYATVATRSLKGMRNEELKTEMKHLCPSCTTTIKIEGVGKNAVNKVVHTCNTCGSMEMTCCLMRKNGGPTTGMSAEKK